MGKSCRAISLTPKTQSAYGWGSRQLQATILLYGGRTMTPPYQITSTSYSLSLRSQTTEQHKGGTASHQPGIPADGRQREEGLLQHQPLEGCWSRSHPRLCAEGMCS